mmetsp:Transcript_48144/g.145413  ORF Transcript_48144/g.145413 Transcript_48144/m.145413 type:complete len:273 (+) Transcript_48144:696-1514(+)
MPPQSARAPPASSARRVSSRTVPSSWRRSVRRAPRRTISIRRGRSRRSRAIPPPTEHGRTSRAPRADGLRLRRRRRRHRRHSRSPPCPTNRDGSRSRTKRGTAATPVRRVPPEARPRTSDRRSGIDPIRRLSPDRARIGWTIPGRRSSRSGRDGRDGRSSSRSSRRRRGRSPALEGVGSTGRRRTARRGDVRPARPRDGRGTRRPGTTVTRRDPARRRRRPAAVGGRGPPPRWRRPEGPRGSTTGRAPRGGWRPGRDACCFRFRRRWRRESC